jgi:hypothetical protein
MRRPRDTDLKVGHHMASAQIVGAPTYSSFTLDPGKARDKHHSNKAEFLRQFFLLENCRRADIVHSNPK